MHVSDVMNKGCQFLSSSDKAFQAAQVMLNHDLGAVPIAEQEKLVGVVTDRDLVIRGVANGADLNSTSVSDLMTDQVYYCFEDQECEQVAANMAEMQVRRMPVVNRDKQLVGVVSLGDLVNAGANEAAQTALQGVSQ